MSDMKCPFCKEEIISDVCYVFDKETRDYINGTQIYKCNKCGLFGTKELWQELIRTRKALEITVEALKDFSIHPDNSVKKYANKVLEQITAE